LPSSRRSRSLRTIPYPKRLTSWASGPEGLLFQTVVAKAGFPTGVAPAEDLTIVRTHGDLLVRLTTSDDVGSGMDFGFGICIVSDQAFAIGQTAIPGPLTDAEWDGWFVHKLFNIAGSIFNGTGPTSVRYEINSKAMRKFTVGNSMVAMIETANEVGAVTIRANLLTRILSKLS